MTAEIINLRQVRKRRAREARAAEAAENRTRFGRTRGERTRDELVEARARLLHEAHRRELDAADTEAERAPGDLEPPDAAPKTP